MRKIFLFFMGVWMAGSLWADDLTRAIQHRLKEQGFYYGEVDGQGGDETSAALRRYQIHSGLKVTGQLNDETSRSLGLSRNTGARPARVSEETERSSREQPNDQYYRQVPRQYDGRPLSRSAGPEDDDGPQPPQFMAPRVVTSFPQIFAGTIYERSPAQVQENVLYAVQGELMRNGFFRGMIDGRPGPATSDAILRLQQEAGLPLSGRLDDDTLNVLRAFPGQRNGPPEEGLRQNQR